MKKAKNQLTRLFPGILMLVFAAQLVAGVPAGETRLAAEIDKVMGAVYKPGEPGAAIIVRRGGRTLFRKGYGLANLEHGIKVEPDMVFRLGSVTKQFTAVAVLMLAQQGKLSLKDEIGKYFPDFPTGGRRVTIEHLLTHTSGITSYTDLAEWLPLLRNDMTPEEIIAMSKDKPFEFAPGERWKYNNSGYIMLGAIIEKVSGRSYEDFVRENIFVPLGMTHSYYDHAERIIPRRVSGYDKDEQGFANASYLSMTQPYSAGSLASSVDDMALWNDAIFSYKLLKKEWLDRAFTPYKLTGGESTGYGYGWRIAELRGHRSLAHSGGINGFTSHVLALPDDAIYVALLTNSTIESRQPKPLAIRIAEMVLGLPPANPST